MVILQFNVHLFIRLLIDVSSGVVRSRAIAPSALSLALGIIALKNQDVPDKTTDRLCNRVELDLQASKRGGSNQAVNSTHEVGRHVHPDEKLRLKKIKQLALLAISRRNLKDFNSN